MSYLVVNDFQYPAGWCDPAQAPARARWCCEQLEEGEILFFDGIPFDLSDEDRQFLLSQKQTGSSLHKNISYRPNQDMLKGSASEKPEDVVRLHHVMRHYSREVTKFLSHVLTPYTAQWALDFASFRPEEEQGRDISFHKRNDLLHIDSFPTRPMHGRRILRCFTNINPTRPRVWLTADRFPELARSYARDAGLQQFAERGSDKGSVLNVLKKAVGLKAPKQSAYDKFMLRFHDYLKENGEFQQKNQNMRIDFPPLCTWMCFTDAVPHAVLTGQYALEQTFIIPVEAMVKPEKAPIRILEDMAGQPLTNGVAA